jgi:hypothetical protein
LDGWDDGSLAVAATNLAHDPTTWMSLTDISPIKANDAIAHEQNDFEVMNVSQAGVKIKSSDGSMTVLPKSMEFFKDTANLIVREARVRKQRTFYAFDSASKKMPVKQDILGLDLIGKTFFSTDDEPGSLPVHYTVAATGDPRKHMKKRKKRLVPILEHVPTAELGNHEFQPHETQVKEVRE